MTTGNAVSRVVEYAIQTLHSKTVLMLTEDRDEAERTLDMLGEGRLLTRTVTYGAWRPVAADVSAPEDLTEARDLSA